MTTLPLEPTFRNAEMAFERREYRQALAAFQEVLADDPTNDLAREYVTRCHFHRASLPLAEASAREMLDRDPTDEYARLLLARTLERAGRHEEAATQRRVLAALTGDDRHAAPHTIV